MDVNTILLIVIVVVYVIDRFTSRIMKSSCCGSSVELSGAQDNSSLLSTLKNLISSPKPNTNNLVAIPSV